MAVRTITGTVYHVDGYPWADAIVEFQLAQPFTTAVKVVPKETHKEIADNIGYLSIDLEVPDTGTAYYKIKMPDGIAYPVYLEAGLPIDLSVLLNIATIPVDPDGFLTMIDANNLVLDGVIDGKIDANNLSIDGIIDNKIDANNIILDGTIDNKIDANNIILDGIIDGKITTNNTVIDGVIDGKIEDNNVMPIKNVSAEYTLLATDEYIRCTGTFPVHLPAATLANVGVGFYYVKSLTGTVTVTANGADLINGAATKVLAMDENSYFACVAVGVWDAN